MPVQPDLQHKNKVGNQVALSSPRQPITASSEAAHSPISAYLEGLANSGPFDRPYHHPSNAKCPQSSDGPLPLACPGVSAEVMVDQTTYTHQDL